MAMNKQRRTSNINNVVTYDTLNNVTIPANLTVKGLITAGFVKTDSNGLFSVDTTIYQAALPSQTGNAGKYLTTNGSVLSWGTVSTINIYEYDGTLTGNRILTSGGYNLTLNPKTFYDNGLTFNASVGNVGTFINTDSYSTISTQLYFYPNSGTNVAQTLKIIPKGTGFNAVFKAQFSVYNTDAVADPSNNEFVTFRAAGSLFTFASGKFGTGTIRPLMFSAGYATDSATNINQLYLSTAGNVIVGGSIDAGYKLDVNGTARIKGYTFLDGGTLRVTDSFFGINTSGNLELLGFDGNANFAKGFESAYILNGRIRLSYINDIAKLDGFASASFNNSFFDIVSSGTGNGNPTPMRLYTGGGDILIAHNGTSTVGRVGIGTAAPNSSSLLDITSTSKGFLPPRMTTTQKNAISSPAAGLEVYDNTLNLPSYYNGTAWVNYGFNIYNSNGTLSGNRTVTMSGNYINFDGGSIGIGASPNAINSLEVNKSNQWSGAFIGNMGGARTPSVAYGIHLGWNYTGGSGEANILWGTGGGGANPYLTFSSWNGTTKVDRMVLSDTGKLTLSQYTSTTSFTGTAVGYIAFDSTGGLITVAAPTAGGISGSGTINYIPKWNGASSLGNSLIQDNGTSVTVNSSIKCYNNIELVTSLSGYSPGIFIKRQTVPSINDSIGVISFYGNSTVSASNLSAYIDVTTDENFATTGYGSSFNFHTVNYNSTTIESIKLSIKSTGQVRFIPTPTPSIASAGDVYYDNTSNKLRCYNGTIWNDLF